MSIVFILVVVMLLVFGICVFKGTWRTIISLFLAWWLFVQILSSLNLYKLNEVSDNSLLIILSSIVAFFVGYCINIKTRELTSLDASYGNKSIVSSELYFYVSAAMLIPIVIFLIRFKTIPIYDYYNIRMSRFEKGAVFHSLIELFIFNYLITPFVYTEEGVLLYGLFKKQIKPHQIIVFSASIVCYSIIGSGRLLFFQFLAVFIIMVIVGIPNFGFEKFMKQLKFSTVLGMLCAIIFVLAVVVYTTGKRLGYAQIRFSDISYLLDTTFSQIYTYVCGPQRAFDYARVNYSQVFDMQYIRMTLSGLDEIISTVLLFFGIPFPSINSIYGTVTQVGISIGDGVFINALYTGAFNMYFDLGALGVIVYSLLFGLLTRYTIDRYYNHPSLPNVLIVAYFFYAMIMYPVKWVFSSADGIILIILCILWDEWIRRKEYINGD